MKTNGEYGTIGGIKKLSFSDNIIQYSNMEKQNQLMTSFNTRCWTGLLDWVKYTVKGWMREVLEEVLTEKMCNVNLEDKRLNSEELCKRWNIGKSTLYYWEKEGRIAPLPLGGRRKIYSMKDVLNAEANGLIKIAC